ncbi:MAG: mechanosensitive ion channel [Chloroflexi bacterium]|nr:mechanosensitive ion channel [Chloroflexota bacterium]
MLRIRQNDNVCPVSWDGLVSYVGPAAPDLIGRLALGVVIFFLAWVLGRLGRRWGYRIAIRTRVDPNLRFIAGEALYWFSLTVGLMVVLALFRIDASVILATFGAAGLALGLAAQDVLKSVFAGVYLLFERPFLIGDEIEVKDRVGIVEHVGLRATTLRTADNVRVVVPNVVIFTEVVANRTGRKAGDDSSGV